MSNSAFLRETSLLKKSDALLKVTALLYLKDALRKEDFESCQELIESAREYGANEGEIKEALVSAAKTIGGGPQEASRLRKRT